MNKNSLDKINVWSSSLQRNWSSPVTEIRLHSKYSLFRTMLFPDHDLALVQTLDAVPRNISSTICLPTVKLDPPITCFIGSYDNADTAYEVKKPTDCQVVNHFPSMTNRQLCAEPANYDANKYCLPGYMPMSCLTSQSQWYISGFVSYQHGCSNVKPTPNFTMNHRHPTLFSNIFDMKGFIDSTLGLGTYQNKREVLSLNKTSIEDGGNSGKRALFILKKDDYDNFQEGDLLDELTNNGRIPKKVNGSNDATVTLNKTNMVQDGNATTVIEPILLNTTAPSVTVESQPSFTNITSVIDSNDVKVNATSTTTDSPTTESPFTLKTNSSSQPLENDTTESSKLDIDIETSTVSSIEATETVNVHNGETLPPFPLTSNESTAESESTPNTTATTVHVDYTRNTVMSILNHNAQLMPTTMAVTPTTTPTPPTMDNSVKSTPGGEQWTNTEPSISTSLNTLIDSISNETLSTVFD